MENIDTDKTPGFLFETIKLLSFCLDQVRMLETVAPWISLLTLQSCIEVIVCTVYSHGHPEVDELVCGGCSWSYIHCSECDVVSSKISL